MSPGNVESNTKYKCNHCGTIVDFAGNPLAGDCPNCGHFDWEQLMIVPVCDFCSTPFEAGTPAWDFPCRTFPQPTPASYGGPTIMSEGHWAACDTCKRLIEDEKVKKLATRAAKASQRINPEAIDALGLDEAIELNMQLYRLFFKNRTGDPYPDEEINR